MKKNMFLPVCGLSLLVLILLMAAGCRGSTPETTEPGGVKVIKLEAVSYWSAHLKDNTPLHYFIDKVNEELGDRLQIELLGGPEVIAVPDQAEAVYNGVIDFLYFPADFYMPFVPEADALKLSEVSPLEMYETGAMEFLSRLFAEKGNAKFFGQFNVGPGWFGLFSNSKIEAVDDINGMIIRTIPAYEAFLTSLGAECTRLSWEEVVTAMERGTIDGFAHSISGGYDIGVHKGAKYLLKPFFYYGACSLVMNLEAWNSLPADLQEELARIAYESQEYGFEWASEEYYISLEGMIGEGLEIIELPPVEAEKFLNAAYEAGWAEMKERAPESYERLREVLSK